jgi:serine protease inhibitor
MEIISSSPNPVILEAQADFAVNLLRDVLSSEGRGHGHSTSTTILSPLSVALVLAMVYAGAKDKTHQEIGQLLGNGVWDNFSVSFHFSLLCHTRCNFPAMTEKTYFFLCK